MRVQRGQCCKKHHAYHSCTVKNENGSNLAEIVKEDFARPREVDERKAILYLCIAVALTRKHVLNEAPKAIHIYMLQYSPHVRD